jgi:holo-[acyl-carrier protein] synthase
MAIYGVGIDLVQVIRIQRMVERWGIRLKKHVFTDKEWEDCQKRKRQVSCLAMRFAAKEALVKALGIGIRSPVRWLDVEIQNNPLGKPEILLSPRASQFCHEIGVRSWHLSLTDDGEYGAAVVVVEC